MLNMKRNRTFVVSQLIDQIITKQLLSSSKNHAICYFMINHQYNTPYKNQEFSLYLLHFKQISDTVYIFTTRCQNRDEIENTKK